MTAPPTRIVTNALAYWAAVFALGFVLGTVRTLWLAPLMGHMAAVLAELPVMLAAAWLCARAILARRPLAERGAALAMGAIAFVLLLGAELLLGIFAFGLTPEGWLRSLGEPAGLLGLAGQIGFALIPAWIWTPPQR